LLIVPRALPFFAQGVALGYVVLAFQAADGNAPKGQNMVAQGNVLGTESFLEILAL